VGRESKSEFTQTRFRQQQPKTYTTFCQNRNDEEAGERTVKAQEAGTVSRGRWTLYNDKLYGYLEDLAGVYSGDQGPLGRTKLEWHWEWKPVPEGAASAGTTLGGQLKAGVKGAKERVQGAVVPGARVDSEDNKTPDCAFPLSIVEFLNLPQPPQHFGEMEMMYVWHKLSDTLASAAGSIALSHR